MLYRDNHVARLNMSIIIMYLVYKLCAQSIINITVQRQCVKPHFQQHCSGQHEICRQYFKSKAGMEIYLLYCSLENPYPFYPLSLVLISSSPRELLLLQRLENEMLFAAVRNQTWSRSIMWNEPRLVRTTGHPSLLSRGGLVRTTCSPSPPWSGEWASPKAPSGRFLITY